MSAFLAGALIAMGIWATIAAAAIIRQHLRRRRRRYSFTSGGMLLPREGWQECACGWCVHPDHHTECAACGKPVRL